MSSQWVSFPCPTMQARWRYLDDGSIEVEDRGVVRPKKWPPGVDRWKDAIFANSAKYNVPAHWIAALMAIEDPSGDPHATSSAGARGLMQLMPGTGRMVAKSIGRPLTSDDDLYDPLLNLELGTAHFAGLLRKYKGDFVSAAVGYNAGRIICLSPTTKCQKGYWGVCTDGSAYPFLAIQGVNGALASGYPSIPAPPPLLPPTAPWVITVSTAIGAALGFLATQKAMRAVKRGRFGFA